MRLFQVAVTSGVLSLNGDGDDLLLEVADRAGAVTALVAFEDPEDALAAGRHIQAWAEKALARRAEGDG